MDTLLRRIVLASVLPLVSLAPSLSFADDAQKADEPIEADVAKGQTMLREGDALADDGKYDDAVLRYMDGYERLLPAMRKLSFKRGVTGHLTPREELKQMLVKMTDDEVKPEQMHAEESAMKVFGLIPADMDLKKTQMDLMSEEVAGFYDSKSKEMHLIKEPGTTPKKGAEKPGLLSKLFGTAGKGFDKDQNKTVLAHELTHALADQYYDLQKMHEVIKDDGDRELALTALIEGEATLTMMGAAQGDWDGTVLAAAPAAQMERAMSLMAPFMSMGGGKNLRNAPPVLQETLIFPYIRGLIFDVHVTNGGSWAALDEVYKHPPLSTEQILHPEKYLGKSGKPGATKEDGYDAPIAVDLGDLKPGGDWTKLGNDVVGELVISIMLAKEHGVAAAAGWGGDSYAVFEGKEGKLGLVWATTWDTEADAREFAASYCDYQTKRFEAKEKEADDAGKDGAKDEKKADAGSGAELFGEKDNAVLRRDLNGHILHLELRGKDVSIVEGFDGATTDQLVKDAFAAKKSEKTSAATDEAK